VGKRAAMLEILKHGLIESEAQVMDLVERYGQMVMPKVNEDLDLTHWFLIREDGIEMLYVGTPETLATYINERDGKIALPN
jgi:hypothetical protein